MPFIGRDGRTAFLPTSVNTSSSLKISNEGDLIVDTDTLFVDSSANRVGIGTASPSRALHINAGPTDTAMLIESTDGDVQINFKDVDSTNGVSIGCDNEDFYVRSGLTTETLRITSDGKVRVPDNGKFTAGAGDDLQIYHNGSHSRISQEGGTDLMIRNKVPDRDVIISSDDGNGGGSIANYFRADGSTGEAILYHYGTKKLTTKSTGIDVTGTVVADGFSAGDDERIKLGAGEDLLLYHDGANSWLINNTGDLSIRNLADDKDVMIQSDNGSGGFETYIQADGSSRAAKLFHSGGVKLETTSAGVTVTGALEVSAATNITVGGTALPSLTGLLGGSLRGTLGVATMHMTASDPSSPVQGQFYFNSLDQKAKIYTGSSFVDLVPAGSGGGGGGGSSSDANATFRKYTYAISSTTNSVSGAAQGETSAGSFVTGLKYTIKTPGNTDFTAIGAGNNTAGTAFVATGAGTSGETGVAYNTLIYSTGGDQNVEVYVNGVKAVEGATNDYIATNGSSVNFVANLASGDVIDIQVYELLTNDAFVLAAGGTFTGNVGINTTSISNRLHINSSGNDEGILLTQAGSHYNGLIADANRTAADNYILNLQANWNGNGVARIAFETGDDTTNKDDGRIKFSTSSSGSNPIVRMHITPSGNVGIGQAEATNATARLQVKGEGALSGTHHKYLYSTDCGILVRGNEAAIDLIGSDAGNHASSILLRNATEGFGFVNDPGNNVHDGALTLKSFTSTADDFYIHGAGSLVTNLVDIVTFTKAGNVGIGTNDPVGNLEVRDSKANLIVAKDGLTVKSNSDLHTSYDMLQIGAGGALASYSVETVTADTQFIHNAYRHSGGTFKYRYADSAARITMNSPQGAIIFANAASGSADGDITFSERLRITGDGDVRIDVDGSAAVNQQGVLRFYRSAYSSGMDDSRIVFDTSIGTNSNNSGTYAAVIAGKRTTEDNGSSELSFYTCNSTNSFAAQERLHIASDGKLSLTGNGANMEYLRMGGSSNDRGLRFTSSSGSSSVGVVHTINAPGDGGVQGAIVLQTNSEERLRIDSAGNTTLGYEGTSLHFQNGFNNSTARIQNGGGSNSSELKFLVRNAGTESEKMRLTSTAGLAIVTAGSLPANAGNETLYIQGEGHNGHGTGNTRSVVSIVGALSSNNSGIGVWIGARTNENTAVIGTRTANGNLAFETYSGGWGERMRLLNTGQFVIGGTANLAHPNMDDLIIGDANGNRGLTICSGTSAFGSVCFGDSADGSGNDRYEGYIEYYHDDDSLRLGTSHTEKFRIRSTANGGTAHFVSDIYFGTNNGNSIIDTGRLQYIESSTVNYYGADIEHSSHVVLTNEQGSTVQAMTLGDTSNGTNGNVLWAVSVLDNTSNPTTGSESGWNQKARVEGNGDFVIAGSYTPSGSDDRLKKNKVTISNALSKVQSMEGFSYEWNEVAEKIGMADDKTHLGLSAQTVQSVAPEVVVLNDCLVNPDDGTNDYMTIRYERLVPMLVEAIKEQQGIIDQLKQRLDNAGL